MAGVVENKATPKEVALIFWGLTCFIKKNKFSCILFKKREGERW